jgi:hypothetical protein
MDQPEQREVTLGSFGELMMLIVAFTLGIGFIAVLGTTLLTLYGSRSGALGFAVAALVVATIAVYGSRELAVVTVTDAGMRIRRPFATEQVPWSDVLDVDYQSMTRNLVITLRSKSRWFRGRSIRVLYRPPSKLALDWREGIKQTFREVSGMQPPDEITFLKEKVAAAQQLASQR